MTIVSTIVTIVAHFSNVLLVVGGERDACQKF